MRSEDESVSGMVVGVVRSACRVDLSRLDSRALQGGDEEEVAAEDDLGDALGDAIRDAQQECESEKEKVKFERTVVT